MSSLKLPRVVLVALLGAALTIGACGGDDEGGSTATQSGDTQANQDVSGNLSFVGIWTGEEQQNFRAVLDAFEQEYPNVSVRYNAAGDNTPTVLSTAIEGGNPPDLATVAQPGLVRQFQQQGALQPLSFAQEEIEANFPADIVELGTIDGELYSFVFKAANKSTVWYNVPVFETAGVEPPTSFDEWMQAAETIQASGTPAFSIAGADGWTLTDLFENIYLRQAGPEMYDQLAEHEIPWTDQSVQDALSTMAQIFEQNDNIVGGRSGALQTDFPTSVTNVFSENPEGAMVIEGDFVPGAAGDTSLEPETGYNVFAFPTVEDSAENVVVGGGDSVVMFNDTPAGQALVEYLASPEAAAIWAEQGGFSSANTQLDPNVYPDEITRTTATAIADAETFRFDMSDLAPAEFGGTPGQGEWQILQDFLANPNQVERTAQRLERAAARAYGNWRMATATGSTRADAAGASVPAPEGGNGPDWGRWLTALAFLTPALALLLVWIVYPTINTTIRSFFDRSGDTFVGLDNYQALFTTDTLLTAIQNNAIWLAVVPALVTAIGMVFAVLTERISWTVAFRTAVFMPMAISMFAAGVIWHVMLDKDPEKGAVNAAIGAIGDAFAGAAPLDSGQASRPVLEGSPEQGFVLRTPVQPGDTAALGLTGIPPDALPENAEQAQIPPAGANEITGAVWRDFRPGGGEPGVVEPEELGVPGATVELRGPDGGVVATTQTGDDGSFSFADMAGEGPFRAAIASETFDAPFAGVSWLGPDLITPSVMIAYIWVWAGFAMVVIAAGLSAIPRDVLEAARTDGASEWQVFRRVTVPMLAPVLLVVFITMLINVLKVFDIVLAVAPGSSQDDANVIALAMWRESFSGANDFGLGSAIAVLLFVLVIPALALNIRRFKREEG